MGLFSTFLVGADAVAARASGARDHQLVGRAIIELEATVTAATVAMADFAPSSLSLGLRSLTSSASTFP
jgi:hypothetical protein